MKGAYPVEAGGSIAVYPSSSFFFFYPFFKTVALAHEVDREGELRNAGGNVPSLHLFFSFLLLSFTPYHHVDNVAAHVFL